MVNEHDIIGRAEYSNYVNMLNMVCSVDNPSKLVCAVICHCIQCQSKRHITLRPKVQVYLQMISCGLSGNVKKILSQIEII